MTDEAQRNSVTVRIAGEEHTIRANAEPEYTKRCAKIVDERIRTIKEQSGLLETHRAAILAALSLTDELLQARAREEEGSAETKRRIAALADALESALDD